MRKLLLLVLLSASFAIVACSGANSNDTAAKIIGTWQGVIEGEDGNTFPSEWEFAENGKLTVIIAPGILNVVQVADYWFDNDDTLRIKDVGADEGTEPGRRVVDFVTENTMTLTAEQAGVVTTLRRVADD